MEHEDAVGGVVGDSGARALTHEELTKEIWGPEAESTINGTVETVYVGEQLVAVIDRDPKYQLNLMDYLSDPALFPSAGTKPCTPIPCGDNDD